MLRKNWPVWPLMLAFLFASCSYEENKEGPNGHTRRSERVLLKSYDVPAEYSAELVAMIRHLLKPDQEAALGSASIGPGGRVMVAAPQGVQNGVEELIAALEEKKPPTPASVNIELWLVAARPSEQAGDLKALGDAAPAMEAVMKQEGPMQAELVEHVTLSSLSAQKAEAYGANVRLEQVATVIGDRVLADLEIDPTGPNQYEARVELVNGRLLVLGESGYVAASKTMPFASDDGHAAKGANLYYIVRAKTTPRQTGS